MEPESMQAVELVRRIRDEQAEFLAEKSRAEILAFFRRAAESARDDARQWEASHPAVRRGA